LLLHVGLLAVLYALYFKLVKQKTPLWRWFWPLALAKGLAVLGFLYVHLQVYQGHTDSVQYHHEAQRLVQVARQDPGVYTGVLLLGPARQPIAPAYGLQSTRQRGTFLVARVVSLLYLCFGPHMGVAGLWFGLLCFLPVWHLGHRMQQRWKMPVYAVLIWLLWPSHFFFTAGIGKEALLWGLWAVLLYLSLPLLGRRALWQKPWRPLTMPARYTLMAYVLGGLLALMLLYGMWVVKYYVAALFAPVWLVVMGYQWWLPQRGGKGQGLALAIGVLGILSIYTNAALINPNLAPGNVLGVVVQNYNKFVQASQPGTYTVLPGLEPTLASVAQHSPKALFSGLLAPLPWQAYNVVTAFAAIENTFFALLLLACLAYWVLGVYARWRGHRARWCGFCCFWCWLLPGSWAFQPLTGARLYATVWCTSPGWPCWGRWQHTCFGASGLCHAAHNRIFAGRPSRGNLTKTLPCGHKRYGLVR